MKQRNWAELLSILSVLILLSGCANPKQTIKDRNGTTSTDSPTRGGSKGTGGDGNDGPLGAVDSGDTYESCTTLTFYSGDTDTQQLEGICVAQKVGDKSYIKIDNAPNLPSGTRVCVITGVRYSSVPAGFNEYYTDIGEQRCGAVTSEQNVFNLVRSDYNIVTVVLDYDYPLFEAWINGEVGDSEYPGLVQSQIDSIIPFPN